MKNGYMVVMKSYAGLCSPVSLSDVFTRDVWIHTNKLNDLFYNCCFLDYGKAKEYADVLAGDCVVYHALLDGVTPASNWASIWGGWNLKRFKLIRLALKGYEKVVNSLMKKVTKKDIKRLMNEGWRIGWKTVVETKDGRFFSYLSDSRHRMEYAVGHITRRRAKKGFGPMGVSDCSDGTAFNLSCDGAPMFKCLYKPTTSKKRMYWATVKGHRFEDRESRPDVQFADAVMLLEKVRF